MDYGFFADQERARLVDAQVRSKLADSLDLAFDALAEAALPAQATALRALSGAIRGHAVRPGVMALYGDLVPTLMDQDEGRLADVIAQLALPCWREPAGFRVVTLADAELGPGIAERYRNHLQDDPENPISLNHVDDSELQDGRRRIADALTLLRQAAPALHDEIRVLINEIVLVNGAAPAGELTFHGASSFFIWGALVLNLSKHGSRVKLVEGIVHEAAHCLLHGFTLGGALTVNAPGERYASPLREDRRPMEGLVHAAYVLARMHLAMGALLQPGLLTGGHITAAEQAEAQQRYLSAARNFRAANEIIAAGAQLTPIGQAVFAQAEHYMRKQEAVIAV